MQHALLETDVAREPDRIDLRQKGDHPKGFASVGLDVDRDQSALLGAMYLIILGFGRVSVAEQSLALER